MQIGIQTTSTLPAAEVFANGLALAVSRQVDAHDGVTVLNGRRHTTFTRGVQSASRLCLNTSELAISRLVAACFSGFPMERTQCGGRRQFDIYHSIGAIPSRARNASFLPFVSRINTTGVPGKRDGMILRWLEIFAAQISRFPLITTWSQDIKNRLVSVFGYDQSRISIIPPGVDDEFRFPICPTDDFELQGIGLLPHQFFLTVGAIDDQANLIPLLLGYASLPARVKAWLPIVVVGKQAGDSLVIPPPAKSDVACGNIRFFESVPAFMLRVLYKNARLVLFPSLAAGLGLSIAQAIICNAPIALSRGSACSFMAGTLATYVEPFDSEHWRIAISDRVDCGTHIASVRYNGTPDYGRNFTWQQSATAAVAIYRRLVAINC